MSNQVELLSPAEVLALIEKAEWQKLDNGRESGICGDDSMVLVGSVDGSAVWLTQRYAEGGPGAESHFFYSASIYRKGVRIGHLSSCYSSGSSDDPNQLRVLYERHKDNFTTRMTKECRKNAASK